MNEFSYWHKQEPDTPLFPNIEWSKPEQKARSGRLGIVGGNSSGFASVAESYSLALATGVGNVRILLPDKLSKSVPKTILDTTYGETTLSGGLSSRALPQLQAIGEWANSILMIGDSGQNSETAVLYENFIRNYNKPLTITRDAIDLILASTSLLVDRPNTLLVLSFAQLQKIFQAVYYPKVLTFNMQLVRLVEAIHKFTITYPIMLAVFHQDAMLVAFEGNVTSTTPYSPMQIWRGATATRASAYWLWNPNKPFEATTTSLVSYR